MEGLLNKAEYILDKSHEKLLKGGCGHLLGQPLFNKLAEIYSEEAVKNPRWKHISLTHHLLEKLVKRDNLNCLVVNLYKGNEGYSLAVKMGSGVETETVQLQYEDEDFLSYLDNEQLPPMILDLFDDSDINIYYSGCIITEIRDFRRALDATYESRYILLKPTNQSLVADIANMTRDKDWTHEERMHLEAEIVKRTAPPLNLCPSPIIALINNKVHQHKYKFSGLPLRKAARRFSQVAQNRQKKFEEAAPPPSLRLFGFLSERKDKRPLAKTVSRPMIPLATEEAMESQEVKSQEEMNKLYQKITEDVKEVAEPLERLQDTVDNSLVFVEEYTLETERGQGRIYLTKLTISQRRTDEIYFGELYVDRDYQEGKQNGSICRFQLGTFHQVERYIKQFKEILTEEGRKTVKILHKVAGQPGTRDKKELTEHIKQQRHQLLLHQLQQEHSQVQQQQIKQGVIGNINLATQQQQVPVPHNQVPTVTVAQPPQNVIIVSNADGTLKKSLNVVSKPITVTSSASLTNLISAQPQHPHGSSVGQQLVVGPSLNLNNLLSGRQLVANRGAAMTPIPGSAVAATVTSTIPQGAKLALNVSQGQQGITKITLPPLATQLNRPPAPPYSQATTVKSQTLIPTGNVNEANVQTQPKTETIVTTVQSSTSNLEALLAGASVNSETIRRNTAIIEKILNTSKMHEDGSSLSNTGNKVNIPQPTNTPVSHHITTSSNTAPVVTNYLRTDNAGAVPPNISLANIANLQGLNVGLQNLATNLSGIQNVQVSFPGISVPIPITFSVPTSASTGSAIIVTSPSPSNIMSKPSATTAVTTSSATVMIANPAALQQGQVVQLPIGQLSGSQLAAQLTKPAGQTGSGASSIPVLQVQGVGGQIFTPVRGSAGSAVGTLPPQTVQVAVSTTQTLPTGSNEVPIGTLTPTSASQLGSSIVTLTPKQPLTVSKQPQLTWQLQQKLMAAKRQQQLQQPSQQQPK